MHLSISENGLIEKTRSAQKDYKEQEEIEAKYFKKIDEIAEQFGNPEPIPPTIIYENNKLVVSNNIWANSEEIDSVLYRETNKEGTTGEWTTEKEFAPDLKNTHYYQTKIIMKDGTEIVSEVLELSKKEVVVNDKILYSTIEEAIEETKNSEIRIKLLNKLIGARYYKFPENKKVILDTNGEKIYGYVENSGTLEILGDGEIIGTIKNYENATLILKDNVKIDGQVLNYNVINNLGGRIIIEDNVKIRVEDNDSINEVIKNDKGGKIEMNGGTIKISGDDNAMGILNKEDSTVVINGGKISCEYQNCICNVSGKIEINEDSIIESYTKTIINGGEKVEINGGVIKSKNGYALYNVADKDNIVTINVGTLISEKDYAIYNKQGQVIVNKNNVKLKGAKGELTGTAITWK